MKGVQYCTISMLTAVFYHTMPGVVYHLRNNPTQTLDQNLHSTKLCQIQPLVSSTSVNLAKCYHTVQVIQNILMRHAAVVESMAMTT